MIRRLVVLVLAVVVMAVAVAPAAQAKPLRSGTIVSGSGWVLEYWLGGCQTTPDCRAWLESQCNPALARRDPAPMASITDVADLADGKTARVFRFDAGKPAGLTWGGTVIQFWRRDCFEMPTSRWRSTDCDGRGGDCIGTTLRIPRYANWMTVTSSPDNVHLVWTLANRTVTR